MTSRVKKLQSKLIEDNQAYLLANSADITYFTGFNFLVPEEREALLVVTVDHSYLLHSSFSPIKKTAGLTHLRGSSPTKLKLYLKRIVSKNKIAELFLDKSALFVDEYESVSDITPLKIRSLDRSSIWEVRSRKEKSEIETLAKSGQIANRTWAAVSKRIEAGLTELELQKLIEALLRKEGSERPAFPTIVAYGTHSAAPHHQPSNTKLTANTAILIDFGATVSGYRSDMTRTIWFGDQPDPQFLQVEKIVKKAYAAVVDKLKKAMSDKKTIMAKDLDYAARNLIKESGYGEQFIHTTGHGIGLDIHEFPSLNWKNEELIKPEMTFTIEPGIYLEDKFGYRYENTILTTLNGILELTSGS